MGEVMGIRLLFLSGIIYLIYMLPQNFFRLDYFNINKVNVTDNSKMLHDELTKLTEKLYNKNSIYIDSNEIKEFIEKDIRVESATVEKKSLGEIDIDVKEKDLAYYAVIGKNIYLTDKEGKIFAYLNEKEIEGVPFIIANNEEEIKEISEFLNEISDLAIFKKISQIYKVNDKEFIIILTDGVKIKTNRVKDNDEISKEKENKRYLIAEQLYFNMSKERKIDYIDLRFNDYIIKYLGDSK
ncbi:POTRA domain protein, FtsQ-type [Fusobacterium nucleatum]|uniref:POTRA domain protein, FtsQ-type n=2 Tax=Fusobacteriaceae TaxID=203492 RepID=A0A133NNM6_FUSNU|nr:POTRA domain protein, FtsQ-type [Fusobacterium nucleatum]